MLLDLDSPAPPKSYVRRRHVDARVACRAFDLTVPDLVLSDPPYNSLNRHIEAGGSTVRLPDFFPTISNAEILDVYASLGARMRPGRFILAACNWDAAYGMAKVDGVDFEALTGTGAPVGQRTGLWWRTPWMWVKTKKGLAPEADELSEADVRSGMGYYGRQAYEMILVLQVPGAPDAYVSSQLRSTCNVIPAPVVLGKKVSQGGTVYPTEKPVELGRALLTAFAPRGGIVLDPFAGSGNWVVGPALEQGLRAEVWDVSEKAPAITYAPTDPRG